MIVTAWHGIALYGVDHATVVNNTVLPSWPEKYMTWITVHPSKDGRPSSEAVVRNNIAGQILAGGINIEIDHNITLRGITSAKASGGATSAVHVELGSNLQNVSANTLVKEYEPPRAIYDAHLAPRSPARERAPQLARRASISRESNGRCRQISAPTRADRTPAPRRDRP